MLFCVARPLSLISTSSPVICLLTVPRGFVFVFCCCCFFFFFCLFVCFVCCFFFVVVFFFFFVFFFLFLFFFFFFCFFCLFFCSAFLYVCSLYVPFLSKCFPHLSFFWCVWSTVAFVIVAIPGYLHLYFISVFIAFSGDSFYKIFISQHQLSAPCGGRKTYSRTSLECIVYFLCRVNLAYYLISYMRVIDDAYIVCLNYPVSILHKSIAAVIGPSG